MVSGHPVSSIEWAVDPNNCIAPPTYFDSKAANGAFDCTRPWSKYFSLKALNRANDWINCRNYNNTNGIALNTGGIYFKGMQYVTGNPNPLGNW